MLEEEQNKYGHFLGCKCSSCDPDNHDMISIVRDAARQLNKCWGHDMDGSDLIVSESKLFSIVFNVVIRALERVEKVLISDRLMIAPNEFKDINGTAYWTCPECKITHPRTFIACPYCSKTQGGYRIGIALEFKSFEEFCKPWKDRNKCAEVDCWKCKENCREIYQMACNVNYEHIGIIKDYASQGRDAYR
jgi:hypothetical protein